MIPAIVLAAGKSTRMGRPKANLSLAMGDSFLTRIVHTLRAADVEEVVVVVGHDAGPIVEAFTKTGGFARFVTNPAYESGQLSSLIAGLNAIDTPATVAALITLVDVPLVAPSTVRALVDRYHQTHAPVVRPVRGSEHGHPVLVSRSLFEEIRGADPAEGAKRIVGVHASRHGDLECDDPGAFLDIDTIAEYERAIASLGKS